MSFQTAVNLYQTPGIEGTSASANPVSTVDFGEAAATAGAAGAVAGRFCWSTDGLTVNSSTLLANVPLGLVKNEHTAIITTWLGKATYTYTQGLPVTVFDRGDFWVRNTYRTAAYGNKVYANMSTGQITTGVTGLFIVDPLGTVTTMTASNATNVLTVTVTNGYIAPGMKISGTFANGLVIPANVYILAQLTGSAGSTGTYSLSQTIGTGTSAAAILATNEEGAGGFDGTATFATSVMTVASVVSGKVAVGQIITSSGVAAGTYVTAQATGTPGGVGTYNLSTAPGTITPAQAITATDWIETPWVVKSQSPEGVAIGETIKIGILN